MAKGRLQLFSFLLAMICLMTACNKEEEPPIYEQKQQTLFMYYPWSGNLTDYFSKNISDMEEAIANRGGLSNERVLVFMSTSSQEASLFEIEYKENACQRTTLKAYTNPSFTTEEGLTGILEDMMSFAPATSYSMIIGCHGSGWIPVGNTPSRGISTFKPHWEYTGGPLTRYFGGTTAAYQTDISTLAQSITNTGTRMEYILFDDCYMSNIETAYELRDVTNYLIGCPTEIMAYGMPYSTIGKYLLSTTPDYQAICDEFYEFYSTYTDPYGTLGITYCPELDALASLMRTAHSRHTFDTSQRSNLQRMDGYSPVLFYDFGDYVTTLCGNDASLLEQFKEQLNKAIPYKTHTQQYYSHPYYLSNPSSGGVIDIRTYSGITTSEPSINSIATTYLPDTRWYQDTH